LTDNFNNSFFKKMRDQVITHQDINNRANSIPSYRRRGIIGVGLVRESQKILEDMIKEFRDYASEFTNPYSDQYFDIISAKKEIESVLSQAEPTLTDSHVI